MSDFHKSEKSVSVYYKRKRRYLFIRRLLVVVPSIVVGSYVVGTFLVVPLRVGDDAMEPSFPQGQFVVVNKLAYGLQKPLSHNLDNNRLWSRTPKRGDAIAFLAEPRPAKLWRRLFDFPTYLLTMGFVRTSPQKVVVRRVVGLPGERLMVTNKQIRINGKPFEPNWTIQDVDPRILEANVSDRDSLPKDIFVEQDTLFVLSDNWQNMSDSRLLGLVALRNVRGRVLFDKGKSD